MNSKPMSWSGTSSEMRFIFNNKVMHRINIEDTLANIQYNPFNKKFKLSISLGVGGPELFPGQILYEKDVEEWKCSLLIIDYIRVYQNVSEDVNNPTLPVPNRVASSDICSQFMPLIRPKKKEWNLVFSDEFNDTESVDQDHWEVKHNEAYCNGELLLK